MLALSRAWAMYRPTGPPPEMMTLKLPFAIFWDAMFGTLTNILQRTVMKSSRRSDQFMNNSSTCKLCMACPMVRQPDEWLDVIESPSAPLPSALVTANGCCGRAMTTTNEHLDVAIPRPSLQQGCGRVPLSSTMFRNVSQLCIETKKGTNSCEQAATRRLWTQKT